MNPEIKPADEAPLEPLPPSPPERRRSFWVPLIVLLVVFLAGFTPMWMKSARLTVQRDRAQETLRLQTLQLTLATAALDARRGDYEPARQGMTSFFGLVTAELDRGGESALSARTRAELQPLLAQRDDLITLLARGDPAAAERVASAYVTLRKSFGN